MVPVPAEIRKEVEHYLMTIDLLTHAAQDGELDVEPVLALMRGMKPP
jgi:hypothetical protein